MAAFVWMYNCDCVSVYMCVCVMIHVYSFGFLVLRDRELKKRLNEDF